MIAFPKSGDIESPTYSGWVRQSDCFGCGARGPSEAHHAPPKGRGVTDDTKTIPVCRSCHQRCHGITVSVKGERLLPISEDLQIAATDAVFRRFMLFAGEAERKVVLLELARWREARGVAA